jgi:hypothetical protein
MTRSLTQAQWQKYSRRCDDRRSKQLQACFEAGRLARREGLTLEKNPFQSHAWRAMWQRGWQTEGESR